MINLDDILAMDIETAGGNLLSPEHRNRLIRECREKVSNQDDTTLRYQTETYLELAKISRLNMNAHALAVTYFRKTQVDDEQADAHSEQHRASALCLAAWEIHLSIAMHEGLKRDARKVREGDDPFAEE